jgi:hypothetical protein
MRSFLPTACDCPYRTGMIRHAMGREFLLFTQNDHAILAGRLAALVGNDRFAPPSPPRPVLTGIAMHDAGWPLHDERPTLNRKGEPLNVLETPMPIATKVWAESARLASEVDDYAGLLVSLHVLTLSALAVKPDSSLPSERAAGRHDMFLLNRFQQDEIERQEELRAAVGLSTDLPLRLGLAQPGAHRDEDLLRFNFAILRAMDAISLDACSGQSLFQKVDGLHPRPGAELVELEFSHPADGAIAVTPWPFAETRIELPITCRRVPAGPYENEAAFQTVFATAATEEFVIRVSPG